MALMTKKDLQLDIRTFVGEVVQMVLQAWSENLEGRSALQGQRYVRPSRWQQRVLPRCDASHTGTVLGRPICSAFAACSSKTL